jgi:hypothetical protein
MLEYILLLVHFIIIIILLFLPYFTKNIYLLLTLIVVYNIILTQYYLLGSCFLNKIENKLLKTQNLSNEGREKSVFSYHIEKLIGEKNTHIFLSLIPLINTIYIYIKLIVILSNKNKKNPLSKK